jgi:hypothetical protein
MKLMNIKPGNISPGQEKEKEKEKEEKSKSAYIMNINYTGILTWWGFNQSSHLCDIHIEASSYGWIYSSYSNPS